MSEQQEKKPNIFLRLLAFLVTLALVLGALAVWFTSPMIVGMLWALLMIPLSSVGIRRLHDLNLPGGIWTVWLTITVILPMFGLSNYMNNEGHLSDYMLYLHYAWLFVTGTLLLFLCFASGQEGPNKYGPASCVREKEDNDNID